jgi:hypothetical protein
MHGLTSSHFLPVDLTGVVNARRRDLPEQLATPKPFGDRYGLQVIRGIPFDFGRQGELDVMLLDAAPLAVELDGRVASFVLVVHVAEDIETNYLDGFADRADRSVTLNPADGFELGNLVSRYELEYEDGSVVERPILRRFAIQQGRFGWGSMPAACVSTTPLTVSRTGGEIHALQRQGTPSAFVGEADDIGRATRIATGPYPVFEGDGTGRGLWIYALPNPSPTKPLRKITCRPEEERSAIYAVTTTDVVEHPLRPGRRCKLRLPLPDGVEPNAVGEVEAADIDLGTVVSARMALDYDHERWSDAHAVVEPKRSNREVLVEYVAHPQARLRLGDEIYDLEALKNEAKFVVQAAHRPVRLRFRDSGTAAPVAVRLHMHGEGGEYLSPRGHHRRVDPSWPEFSQPEFVNIENQYAHVDGECEAELPLGTVYVEISRGYEVAPIRTAVEIGPETNELLFELEKVLDWRGRGWVTADTHVHFLSPQTALLEGKAEGVNVVNLLASQWGEMFSNVGDFDGRTTFGAEELGGAGEFLVRVGSENRMNVLGHISLLGYSGRLIEPLCTAGPDESAFGDALEATMAEWAKRCVDQDGLVVMPHSPAPQMERAADIVLGLVDAVEMMTLNPLDPKMGQLNPYGLADWYRYLNLGYRIPVVGGSDKMSTTILLGGVRTYAQIGERELTYKNWMDAIRIGNTFVTVGPLASVKVEGIDPGGDVELPPGGGTVQVEWEVESVGMPIERVEVVAGGLVAEELSVGGELTARGTAAVTINESGWIALRVRGSYHGRPGDIAAHTSAVQILVKGSELFSETDASIILDQIQGAIAFVDTLAPRAEARRFRELRATLESAYNRLHQRMHAAGVYHSHPLHDPGQPHEH